MTGGLSSIRGVAAVHRACPFTVPDTLPHGSSVAMSATNALSGLINIISFVEDVWCRRLLPFWHT